MLPAATLLLFSALGQSPQRVTLVFGGDVIPHEPVRAAAKANARAVVDPDSGLARSLNADGWLQVLGPLAPVFRSADIAIVNLESPLTTRTRPDAGNLVFHARPELARALKAVGVTVATFANNHGLDQHRAGIVETRRHLREAGLLTAGAAATEGEAWAPLIIELRGLRVGVLAFTRFLNGFHNLADPKQPHVPLVHHDDDLRSGGLSQAEAVERVRAAAKRCDVLIVTPHWGDEYKEAPRKDDRALMEAMLAAGAAAVVGHHPHVLQPVERVRRPDGGEGVVVWSLGNLLSNQDPHDERSLKRDGLLVTLEVTRAAPGQPVDVRLLQSHAAFTHHGQGRRHQVQVRLVADEADALAQRLSALSARLPSRRAAGPLAVERARLTKKLAVLNSRRARIEALVQPALQPSLAEARAAGGSARHAPSRSSGGGVPGGR